MDCPSRGLRPGRDHRSVALSPDTRVPRVIFRHRQPGWRFDLGARTLGLVHAQPNPADAWKSPHPTQCRAVHWPPGPADQLATKWMPLALARLTPDGIKPSVQTTAELDRLAAIAASELAAERARAEAAARTRDERNHVVVLRSTAGKVDTPSDGGQFPETHEAFRWDAFSARGRSGYLVLWLQHMRVGADRRDAQSQPGRPRDPDHGTHQSRAAARDRASVRWRTKPGPNVGRLSTAHAALDVRARWRDGQRCKLAQLADAGGNHGASLHHDRSGYDGGPLPSGFRRGGDW